MCCYVFVFLQHINTISTGMLSLILVEPHKMSRWFVSSIILHHAQYIEWFSNHSSSPWPPDYMFEWCCQRRPLRRVRRKTKREMAALLVVRRNTGQTSAQASTKKPGHDSKSVNFTLSNNDGASGYGNLFIVLSVY